jgi:UDP-N-acetylglucosamine transferase subunit ALG13
MIFITVGTTQNYFLRMRKIVLDVAYQNKNETVIFQHGFTPPVREMVNVKNFHTLPYDKMIRYIKTARIIICHGGPATIFQALRYGKVPYVLAREQGYKEHVNNHQQLFSKFMEHKNYIIMVSNDMNFSLPTKIIHTRHFGVDKTLLIHLTNILEQ